MGFEGTGATGRSPLHGKASSIPSAYSGVFTFTAQISVVKRL
jgi:hypothetical protein